MEPKPKAKKQPRVVYPLDITPLTSAIATAKRKSGIKSKAQLLRMAIERGLPVLLAQLSSKPATS